MFATVLAHQGGWDEVLLIAGPIIAIAGLLILAKKRVDAAAESVNDSETTDDTATAEPVGPEASETATEPTG